MTRLPQCILLRTGSTSLSEPSPAPFAPTCRPGVAGESTSIGVIVGGDGVSWTTSSPAASDEPSRTVAPFCKGAM